MNPHRRRPPRRDVRLSQSRARATLALAAALSLASVEVSGCASAIRANINAQFEAIQQFNEAVKYSRWEDAIRLAEGVCHDVPSTSPSGGAQASKRAQCASYRRIAYAGRAADYAKVGNFEAALADETRASEALDDLVVANSQVEGSQRDLGVPAIGVETSVKAHAMEAERYRAESRLRLAAYRSREIPGARREVALAPPAPASLPATSSSALVATPAASWPELTLEGPAVASNATDAALIVGIEHYLAVPGVAGGSKNATDWYLHFTKRMGIPSERVTLLRDHEATVEKIERFAKKATADVRPGGTLWFVFIGHGAPARDGRDGVLVGADAQQDADSLYARSIAKKRLQALLVSGNQHSTIMLLDACFSGRADGGTALIPGLQPLIVEVAEPTPPPSQATIITAGKSDEFAGPLPGLGRPAFSYLMLGALRGWADANGDGKITAEEATTYVRNALLSTVKGRSQTPELQARERGKVLATGASEAGPDIARLVAQ